MGGETIFQAEKDRTVTNATRTNLKVQPEREDLIPYSEDIAEAGAGDVELVGATADQKIKVYACGYDSDGDIEVCFRFATGTKKFGRRITAGVYAQTFLNPMTGGVNEALNFRVEGAVNAKVWIHYVKE